MLLLRLKRGFNIALPWIKNSAQITVIYAAGDFTQQKLVSKVEKYNYESTKHVALVGGGILAPFYVTWYNFLQRKLPGKTGHVILKKVMADQLIAGVIGTCMFFIVMSILEEQKDVLKECKEKAPTAYLCNTLYWPFVMIGVFKKIPVAYQPIAVACGDFVWSIFLCYYKMKDIHADDKKASIVHSKDAREHEQVLVEVNES